MATLGISTLMTEVDLDGLDRGLKQGKTASQSGFKQMGLSARDLFAGAVASAAVVAAKAIQEFANESLNEFRDFEKGAAEVFTLLPDLSAAAMAQMEDDVLEFSKAAGRTTDETIPALYQAISAGVPQENVFDFLTVASDAARGGVTDLETAVDGITSVTNAYGLEMISAAEASDVMFTAVKLGKTNFEQLSGSLFNVIPTAASLGVKFEDVAANLAALTAQGTPTSVATTQLRQAFVEASKSGTLLDKALRDLTGSGFADLIASGMTSQEIFLELRNSMPEQAFRDLFGSVEASNAVLGITSETALTVINSFGTLEDTIGATAAAAQTMAETTEFLEGRLAATDEALKIQAGEAINPLKNSWLNLRIGVNEYFSEDLARRTQIENMTAALEEQGITGISAQKIINQLGEGTTVWRDSMESADVMARRFDIALGLLEDGHTAVASKVFDSVVAIENRVDATQNMTSVEAQAAMQLANSTSVTQDFTDATKEADEALSDFDFTESIEGTKTYGEITLFANAMLEDEARLAELTAEAEEEKAAATEAAATAATEAAEAALEAAEAERQHQAALGGYFTTALTATDQTVSLERQLFDMAASSGAGAAELAVLAAATGDFSDAQIKAAFEAAVMQEQISMLAKEVANGNITADEAVDALSRMQGQMVTAGEESGRLTGTFGATSDELGEVSSAADKATTSLNSIPTDIDVKVKIKTEGSIPTPKGNNGDQAFMSGGFTGVGAADEIAGVVHKNELVVPASALSRGASGILDFANENLPDGLMTTMPVGLTGGIRTIDPVLVSDSGGNGRGGDGINIIITVPGAGKTVDQIKKETRLTVEQGLRRMAKEVDKIKRGRC